MFAVAPAGIAPQIQLEDEHAELTHPVDRTRARAATSRVLNPMAEFRILIVRLSSMGDVIHTLPAAASLKHSIPNSRRDLVDSPALGPAARRQSLCRRSHSGGALLRRVVH